MKKKLMAFLIAFVLTLTITGCGTKNDDTDSNKKTSSSEKTESTEKSTSTEESSSTEEVVLSAADETVEGKSLEEATEEEDIGKYHVKIKDAEVTTDNENNQVIVIKFDFTNNSDTATSAYTELWFDALQEDNLLDPANIDNTKLETEVEPETTLEDCRVAFELKGTSDVEFQVCGNSNNYAKKTFSVK